jgi:hypothetical protein
MFNQFFVYSNTYSQSFDTGNLLGVNVPNVEELLINNGVFSLFISSSNIDYQLFHKDLMTSRGNQPILVPNGMC